MLEFAVQALIRKAVPKVGPRLVNCTRSGLNNANLHLKHGKRTIKILTVMDVTKRPRKKDTSNSSHSREDTRNALTRNGVLAHYLPARLSQRPPQRHSYSTTLITPQSNRSSIA